MDKHELNLPADDFDEDFDNMENEICPNDYCSFCGGDLEALLAVDEVTIFTAIEKEVVICSNCINSLADSIDTLENETHEKIEIKFDKKPKDIVDELNKVIVGQENAKRSLALAAYHHYKRIASGQELDKNNILLVGPTGSGKTLIAKTLAKILNVPCYIVRANSITEAGYVGDDVESIIEGLLEKAGGNPALAEIGIVFIDEVDKISKAAGAAIKDVSGVGAQNALLTLLEDDDIIAYKKSEFRPSVKVNTKNILFIASGAFSGIAEIANKRSRKSSSTIGFTAKVNEKVFDQEFDMVRLQNEDFIEYGLVPEFVGRFPVLSSLKGLDIKDIERIITEPENSIFKQYQTLFKNENTVLQIEPDALHELAKLALVKKTGARGLKGIFNFFFEDALFEAANDKFKKNCVLTKDNVISNTKASIKRAPAKKQAAC